MTGIDEYVTQVRGSMLGMDPRVRSDILRELRTHLADAAATNGGDAGPAIASFGSPADVGREYRRLYGYGKAFKFLFVAAAALLALASSPFLSVAPDGVVPNPLSLIGLLAVVGWLLTVSVSAGSRVGLYAGLAALLVRTAGPVALAASNPGGSVTALGGAAFAATNGLLVVLGWLPGTAKQAWSKPVADL